MQAHVMAVAAAKKSGLIDRCLSLTKVLCFGDSWLRGSFIALLCLWGLAYTVKVFSLSVQLQAVMVMVPVLLQVFVALFIGMRAAFLLGNSQLHLMGLRKELYISLLLLSALFGALVFDPKDSENLYRVKLLVFNYISLGLLWMMLLFSFQLLPMFVLALAGGVSVYLIFAVDFYAAMSGLAIFVWVYIGFWLWHSPLQRQFKFESFTGLVDYCVERLKIARLKEALTRVKNKEHVLLMGEGDGYLNRIILAPVFSLVFTLIYVVFMHSMRELCLWMILLFLNGTKAKLKITQSHAKLWLLSDGGRIELFKTAEKLTVRLNLYLLLMASLMLGLWISMNSSLLIHGIAAVCLSFLLVIATDYYTGLILPTNKVLLMVLVFVKMGFMAAITFMQLSVVWYLLMAVVLLFLCVVFRKRAQKDFLRANLSVRAS
jgi:hypothetical protein